MQKLIRGGDGYVRRMTDGWTDGWMDEWMRTCGVHCCREKEKGGVKELGRQQRRARGETAAERKLFATCHQRHHSFSAQRVFTR